MAFYTKMYHQYMTGPTPHLVLGASIWEGTLEELHGYAE